MEKVDWAHVSILTEGNTKFSNQELQQQLTPYLNKPITFAQLIAARTAMKLWLTMAQSPSE